MNSEWWRRKRSESFSSFAHKTRCRGELSEYRVEVDRDTMKMKKEKLFYGAINKYLSRQFSYN